MSGRKRPPRQRRAELSQHFLREATAARLVRATSIDKTNLVLEIGPGRGALTKPLTKVARQVVAVELDGYLAAKLQQTANANLHVIAADFLRFALPAEPYSVVGNVPFARSTEIIQKLSGATRPPDDAWLVVQRELAYRMCGSPFRKETLWSLRLKPVWHLEVVARLKKTEFDPPPSVDSVFLHLRHRGRPLITVGELRAYFDLLESVFARNLPLDQALRPQFSKRQIQRLSFDLCFGMQDMPSDLLFEQWLGIFRFLRGGQ